MCKAYKTAASSDIYSITHPRGRHCSTSPAKSTPAPSPPEGEPPRNCGRSWRSCSSDVNRAPASQASNSLVHSSGSWPHASHNSLARKWPRLAAWNTVCSVHTVFPCWANGAAEGAGHTPVWEVRYGEGSLRLNNEPPSPGGPCQTSVGTSMAHASAKARPCDSDLEMKTATALSSWRVCARALCANGRAGPVARTCHTMKACANSVSLDVDTGRHPGAQKRGLRRRRG